MRILVTGASSLPGYRATLSLLEKGHSVVALYLTHEVPITDPNLVKLSADVRDSERLSRIFEKYRPDAVVHMAAYGDVDGCERDRKLAWNVNVRGTIHVVRLAAKYCKFLLYLSTDYVFDGLRGDYREDDTPCPVNFYGLTKLCGEVATLSSSIGSAVVRASSIYGLGPGRTNFAKFLIERLSKRERVKALVDQYTTPTQASLLGEAIAEILEREISGVFHVVGERLSRYEFALKVADVLDFDRSLIDEAKMCEFSWAAPRPRDSSLSCDYTRRTLKTNFYPSEVAFKALREEYESMRRA